MMLKIALLAVLAGAGPSWGSDRHEVVDKDHLWGLAGKYYGNNLCWRAIYEANKGAIKDPHWIYPKQVLDMPDSSRCASKAGAVEASAAVTVPVETAAPVEASAPVEVSAPVEASAQVTAGFPEPAQTPAAPAAPAPRTPAGGAGKNILLEAENGLMDRFPKGQTGSSLAEPRVEFPIGWKPDGTASLPGVAERGAVFPAKMKLPAVQEGDRFGVYRKAAPLETDKGKKALFFNRIATVQAVGHIKKKEYSFRVIKSGNAVLEGDLLKLEP